MLDLEQSRAICREPGDSPPGARAEAARRVEAELTNYDEVAKVVAEAVEYGRRLGILEAVEAIRRGQEGAEPIEWALESLESRARTEAMKAANKAKPNGS